MKTFIQFCEIEEGIVDDMIADLAKKTPKELIKKFVDFIGNFKELLPGSKIGKESGTIELGGSLKNRVIYFAKQGSDYLVQDKLMGAMTILTNISDKYSANKLRDFLLKKLRWDGK